LWLDILWRNLSSWLKYCGQPIIHFAVTSFRDSEATKVHVDCLMNVCIHWMFYCVRHLNQGKIRIQCATILPSFTSKLYLHVCIYIHIYQCCFMYIRTIHTNILYPHAISTGSTKQCISFSCINITDIYTVYNL